ncbi:MAG: chemotaxis protein CheB [Deltaproteobacteria bacterium]|nr:chemotaxis protein CheB [Deltaproteobacteria bacterium]
MVTHHASRFECIVIGVSAGGMDALLKILPILPADFPLPVVVVQHLDPHSTDSYFAQYFNERCPIEVREANEREPVMVGNVYFAPPNYHLLIENDKTFSLSSDDKINFSRPSIDVLFESAADVYGQALVGLILTGASSDGAIGLKRIKENGGLTIVQDPKTAESNLMPLSAIQASPVDHILSLQDIPNLLQELVMEHITDVPKTKKNKRGGLI